MSQDNLSAIYKPQPTKKKCSICPRELIPKNWNAHWKAQHPGEEIRELKEGESVREPDFQLKTGKFISGEDDSRRSNLGRTKKNQKPDIDAISSKNHVSKRQKIECESFYD